MHFLMYSGTLKSKSYLLFFECFMQLTLPRWFVRMKPVVLFKYNINKHKTKYKTSTSFSDNCILTMPKGLAKKPPSMPAPAPTNMDLTRETEPSFLSSQLCFCATSKMPSLVPFKNTCCAVYILVFE